MAVDVPGTCKSSVLTSDVPEGQRHFGGGRDFAGLLRRDAFARKLHGGIADGVEQRHRIDLPFAVCGLVRHAEGAVDACLLYTSPSPRDS